MSNQVIPLDPRLIFTDLDGTLIDHNNYSFAPAIDYLAHLRSRNITVIPNTSKTYAEVIKQRSTMLLEGPFIIENGAGVFIPIDWLPEQPHGTVCQKGFWVKAFSKQRPYWLAVVDVLRTSFPNCFEAFSEMTTKRLAQLTGLTEQDAKLALQRHYSEPLLWIEDEKTKQKFIKAAQKAGARPLLGGRFLHICGQSNKGEAMQWLATETQRQLPHLKISTIALGDGGNDVDMLELADIAVRIASPAHEFPHLQRKHNVFNSETTGPQGWVEVLQEILID